MDRVSLPGWNTPGERREGMGWGGERNWLWKAEKGRGEEEWVMADGAGM